MDKRSVITIGNFDGVHLGHRAILARAREVARRLDARVVAMPFAQHVATLLRPGSEPPALTTLEQRTHWLKAAGADAVERIIPNRELLALSPEAFIGWLRDRHDIVAIVEGSDFRFGHKREGDMARLTALGKQGDFAVESVEPVMVTLSNQLQATVSSTLVRWLVGQGRVMDAARCLGRAYELHGAVTQGEQRGRTIGVPTANLDLAAVDQVLIPANGVYAGLADLPDGEQHAAAISIGVKPTFGHRQLTVEAHLLDFEGDLYGKPVTLRFHRWLREQMAFPALASLKAQLGRDIAEARRVVLAEA